MQATGNKMAHNKRNYEAHKPYPVRLGILRDLIYADAFEKDQSAHWCIVRALEKYYWPQLITMAINVATVYPEVLRLVKLQTSLAEALAELRVDAKLFMIGITTEEEKELLKYLGEKEAALFQQKKGYYTANS